MNETRTNTNKDSSQANPSAAIQFRLIEPADEAFLLRVYAGERADELALVPWDERQKQAFVEMQFAAQSQHYREQYPLAQQQVIFANGQPVGRLYLDRGPAEFRILDIGILPENRKAGIGAFVLRNIMNEARVSGLPVTIYVDTFSPALKFFEQLGFRRTTEHEFKVLMQWDAESPATGRKDPTREDPTREDASSNDIPSNSAKPPITEPND
jgi:GNAT superfamily N-acetyltransferase